MNKFSFETAEKLLEICEKENKQIYEIAIEYTKEKDKVDEATIRQAMKKRLDVIRDSIKKGIENENRSASGLSGGDSAKLLRSEIRVVSPIFKNALIYSMAVMEHNAKHGKIVAFPTAGSAGTVPGALLAVADELQVSEEEILNAMFTSAAIGMITGQKAYLAGASGGCQAEVGTSAAMAAAAVVYLLGGNPKQSLTASAVTLKNMLGLVCDPIAGLVEAPCVKRNCSGVTNALTAAELSMAGIESNVNYDEVVETMRKIGDDMASKYKETSRGGLAATPFGKRLYKRIYNKDLEE